MAVLPVPSTAGELIDIGNIFQKAKENCHVVDQLQHVKKRYP
jgi:hypothetical protein